jgi:hypothetical protein
MEFTRETVGPYWRVAEAVRQILEQAPPQGMTRRQIADASRYTYSTIITGMQVLQAADFIETTGNVGSKTPGVGPGYAKLYRLSQPGDPQDAGAEQGEEKLGKHRRVALTIRAILQQGPPEGMTLTEITRASVYRMHTIIHGMCELQQAGIAEKGGTTPNEAGGFRYLYQLSKKG